MADQGDKVAGLVTTSQQEWKPPYEGQVGRASVFLAGSIEMGKASEWQGPFAREVINELGGDVTVFNPRRDDWDPSWKPREDCPQFKAQVEWELRYLELADVVAMYFETGTVSIISMLEFGRFCGMDKLVVCCPEEFHRSGNVWVTAHWYGKCKLVTTMQELKQEVMKMLHSKLGDEGKLRVLV
ncbi:hypothetical protein B0J14DRAFT_609314 [Halenospora varia]|nr:hypothetical protein B0J14DRAFT_609314 [Halenospora varia]